MAKYGAFAQAAQVDEASASAFFSNPRLNYLSGSRGKAFFLELVKGLFA
jgi:hypothetical protein